MPGTFTVEWLPGGILLQRRSGILTVEQAQQYLDAVKAAIVVGPAPWGAVVDTRDAGPQLPEFQPLIADLIEFGVEHHMRRIAVVTATALTGIQQRRSTVAPGLQDTSTIAFFTDYDLAVAEIAHELTATAAR